MKRLLLGLICTSLFLSACSQASQAEREELSPSPATEGIALSPVVAHTPTPAASATPSPSAFKVDKGIIFLRRDQENLSRLELFDLTSGKSITSSLSIGLSLSSSSEVEIRQSPDGNWIAVRSGSQLFLVDSALEKQLVVPFEGSLRSWDWSPDASTIAILSGPRETSPRLDFFELATFRLWEFPLFDHKPVELHRTVWSMAWSPKSDKLLFFSAEIGELMFLLNISANSLEQLPKERMCGGFVYELLWSPDGKWFANYASWNGRGAYGRICAYNFAEKTFFPIEHSISKSNPVWSLDGRSLYFVRKADGNLEKRQNLMRFDTFDQQVVQDRLLTEAISGLDGPRALSLSPDGRTLTMLLIRSLELGRRIAVVSLTNNTEQEHIINLPAGRNSTPAWLENNIIMFSEEEQPGPQKQGRFYRVNLQTNTTTAITEILSIGAWDTFTKPNK